MTIAIVASVAGDDVSVEQLDQYMQLCADVFGPETSESVAAKLSGARVLSSKGATAKALANAETAAQQVAARSDVSADTLVATWALLGSVRESAGQLPQATLAFQTALSLLEREYGMGHAYVP